jgi:hypothetical protein
VVAARHFPVGELQGAPGLAVSRLLWLNPGMGESGHTTSSLRDQVKALAERGLLTAAIADTLNISDRRVTALLREDDLVEQA